MEEPVKTAQEEDKKMQFALASAVKENSYYMQVTNIQFEISNLEAKQTTLTSQLVSERTREHNDSAENNRIRVSLVQTSDTESKKLLQNDP
jgi:hypothetical protein